MKLLCKGRIIDFENAPSIMGILNVTPDSFSDGGEYSDVQKAVRHGIAMVEDGADIIDIGGESTRPGFTAVDAETEIARVVPVIDALHRKMPELIISIDTSKPEVAEAALQNGASIVNDVTAFEYGGRKMLDAVARHDGAMILMHSAVQDDGKCLEQVQKYLERRLQEAVLVTGLDVEHFAVDPGIGFAKSLDDNLELTAGIGNFHSLGVPVLLGISRKSCLGMITGKPVTERLSATLSAVSIAAFLGADILRVHDVKEAKDAVKVAVALRQAYDKID